MSKCLKKLFVITISLAILIACIPTVSVFAADYSGKCGENVTWSLDTQSGILTISGSGDMYDYDSSSHAPWYSRKGYIKSVSIENGVTSIGFYAFYGCSSLTSVTIPDSVTSIDVGAFIGCSSLTSITIPDSVASIEIGAFENCSSLTSVDIPDSVTYIGDYAFDGCSSLTSVDIPDSVTFIGDMAFNDTAYYNNEDNWTNDVLFIDNHLISAKDSLSGEYIIPAGTKTMASGAFKYCRSLTSVTIPDGVTSIGGYAFENCNSLTTVTIPDSVTSIGIWAFKGCNNLTIRCYKNSAAHNYAIANDILYIIIKDSVPAPKAPTVESKTNSSVTLIATDGYEYSIDGINWQTSNVFYNLESNTEYTFYQRVAETDTTYASESSTGTVVSTNKYIIGDANGDGRINNKDLGLLMQKLNGWAVEIDDAVADVNADGKVNNKDYGLLMQYVNGWEVVIG